MKARKKLLPVVALAALALMASACNKTDSSVNANANSPAVKNGNSASGAPPAVSKRFVGTWAEEGEKNDQGSKFTEDGKVIEVSSGKQVGTYTATGNDKATITIAEGGTASATLVTDDRMLMETGTEKAYLIRK
jgi:hypothetical protein